MQRAKRIVSQRRELSTRSKLSFVGWLLFMIALSYGTLEIIAYLRGW